MVKLYTDLEMEKLCKDFKPIPLAVEQDILHYEGNPNYISILNGIIKSPYKSGQPVNNVIDYAHQLSFQAPIDPETFLKEYNRVVDQKIKDKNVKLLNELSKDIANDAMMDALNNIDGIDKDARTKASLRELDEMAERFGMETEDQDAPSRAEMVLAAAQRARARFRRDNPDYDRERDAKMQDYLDRKQSEAINEARVGMKGEDKPKKTRRTKEQMIESKTMATEDINYAEL